MHNPTDYPTDFGLHMQRYFTQFLYIPTSPETWVASEELYAHYLDWYMEHPLYHPTLRGSWDKNGNLLVPPFTAHPCTQSKLTRLLREHFPDLKATMRTIDGRPVRGHKNLGGPPARIAQKPGRKPKPKCITFDPFESSESD